MARHGGKTVLFGRFDSILRYTVAWVAGLSRMRWWRFLFWNPAGGIARGPAGGLIAHHARPPAAGPAQRPGPPPGPPPRVAGPRPPARAPPRAPGAGKRT